MEYLNPSIVTNLWGCVTDIILVYTCIGLKNILKGMIMKEFKKWWASISTNYISYVEAKRDGRLVSAGWRAALRMVQSFADAETCSRIDDELDGKDD